MSAYLEENSIQRQRLQDFADRLTDADLRRDVGNGLSVADELVHLAFWDDYCVARLKQWERTGYEPVVLNYDTLNAAVLTLARAIPAPRTIELALAAADAVDRQVDSLSPELTAALEASGASALLDRAGHRRAHLDQIHAALG